MRKEEISINVNSYYYGQMTLEYPDEVAFVFNPLYLNMSMDPIMDTYRLRKLKVTVSRSVNNLGESKSIDVELYKGKARVYLSRLMELFFTDIRFERSKTLFVNLIVASTIVKSLQFMCIWGNLVVGERLAHYGAFKLDQNRPYFERKRIWFRKFPFTISMFAHTGNHKDRDIYARYDDNPYDKSINTYYPPIFTTINSLEVGGLDEETVYNGDNLEGACFDRQEQCFYGSTDEGNLYKYWTAGYYVPGPEEYNTNGKARTDRIWAMPNGRLVRYDPDMQDLVDVPYGRSGATGIFEISPSHVFPKAQRSVTLKQKGDEVEGKASVFDTSFDYTFWMLGEMSTITELIIDNSTAGHYLRWIDRLGMFQYFLFVKGKETLKNKLGANTVVEDYTVGGMYFANHERTTNIEGTKTIKCCAVALEEAIYDYVSSIINSPIIDLYIGKTKFGDEMWVPVNIVAANHDYDPKELLHDLEISFTMPPVNAQTL